MIPLLKVSGDIVYYVGEGILQNGIETKLIYRIVKEAGRIIGVSRRDFEAVYADLLSKKLTGVMDDSGHPLHDRFSCQLIPRSGRMRLSFALTNRYLSSFVPQATRLHNSNYTRGAVHSIMN